MSNSKSEKRKKRDDDARERKGKVISVWQFSMADIFWLTEILEQTRMMISFVFERSIEFWSRAETMIKLIISDKNWFSMPFVNGERHQFALMTITKVIFFCWFNHQSQTFNEGKSAKFIHLIIADRRWWNSCNDKNLWKDEIIAGIYAALTTSHGFPFDHFINNVIS